MKNFAVCFFVVLVISTTLYALNSGETVSLPQKYIRTIIIDPGHGGRDPGAIWSHIINGNNTIFIEKDITLKIGQLVIIP